MNSCAEFCLCCCSIPGLPCWSWSPQWKHRLSSQASVQSFISFVFKGGEIRGPCTSEMFIQMTSSAFELMQMWTEQRVIKWHPGVLSQGPRFIQRGWVQQSHEGRTGLVGEVSAKLQREIMRQKNGAETKKSGPPLVCDWQGVSDCDSFLIVSDSSTLWRFCDSSHARCHQCSDGQWLLVLAVWFCCSAHFSWRTDSKPSCALAGKALILITVGTFKTSFNESSVESLLRYNRPSHHRLLIILLINNVHIFWFVPICIPEPRPCSQKIQ